jgi:hypothetical protein
MATFYLDYINGNNANDGSTWALAWKDITNGATAARIAPGDVIRIAKSPAPTSIGNATWTNVSKTVTLATAQTANIDRCETAWTAANSGTVTLTAVATDGKEGSYCMQVAVPASPVANTKYAYHATGKLNLSAYQNISFWVKNSAAIDDATTWKVVLCSDTAGVTIVNTFYIPAIPSANRWIPLTLAQSGGGNLGSSIQSIAIYTDASLPTGSSYLYVDNFIACTTNGLNLQSLISKNSSEQGGTDGWYGIQSINGTTVMLDNDTSTKANAGRGYSGVTETVTTYKRETIKTTFASSSSTSVQEVQNSGTLGSNIEFQGGWNTATNTQDGETFFDGLNGNGYGLYLNSKSYTTINYLNFSRYSYGIYLGSSTNNTITTVSNANNNTNYGIFYTSSPNNIITTVGNVNNNSYGIIFSSSPNSTITTISNANNNNIGIYLSSSPNSTITTISNANNNANYGINFSNSPNNTITSLSTSRNGTAGIYITNSTNYITNASLSDTTKVTGYNDFTNDTLYIQNYNGTGYAKVFTDGGNIASQASTLTHGSGTEWILTTENNTNRQLNYPLKLTVARIACVANKQVTVTCWFKKGHATNIGARLVFPAQLGASTTYAECPSDTNEHQLTVTFTPTEAGVATIEAWAYYIAGHSTVIIDNISVTQES